MNRKRAAWLLAAVMMVTSVDSSAVMVSAADFSDGESEIEQDFIAEPAEQDEASGENQHSKLKKLTIKSEPEKRSFAEGIDYPLYTKPKDIGEEYAKGLVVTAEYEDGKTEDLEYGDKSRYGDTLSVWIGDEEVSSGDEEDDEGMIIQVMYVSMAGVYADYIPIERLSFEQYLKYKGEDLEILPMNEMKTISLKNWCYQVYSFIPKETADYTFYSTGSIDTAGRIYSSDGEFIRSDHNSGDGLNFKVTNKLTAGKRYYLAVNAGENNRNDGGGECMIGITKEESQEPTPTPTPAIKMDLAEATVTGIDETYIYTGNAITPALAVTFDGKTLTEDTDYNVAYSDNTKSGTATVKITGKGDYTGEKTVTFRIVNKITYRLKGGEQNSNNKTTFYKENVKLYSPTRKGYTFGGWYKGKTYETKMTSISEDTVKNVTLYAKWIKVSKCKAPANVKLKNSQTRTMTVSYASVSGAKGYEISYATNAQFKGAKKVSTTAKNRNISNLKKGTTYYVRVRAYKTDSTRVKIYGNYSKTEKVRIN